MDHSLPARRCCRIERPPRSGRPRLATAAVQAEAIRSLEGTPEQTGASRTSWTRRLLGRHLAERMGCWLSLSSVTRLIARIGFVWRRPKLTLKQSDPCGPERAAAIAEAIATHPKAPRIYEDECDIHHLPVVRGQYQRRGQQQEVPTPGQNRKQPIFGFLNVLTGQWHYWLTKRKRSVDFLTCLHQIYQFYPDGPILLFLDNASIHKSRLTLKWLSHHERFLVYYLPAYSGNQTNPVEKVWWALKDNCMANYLYCCLDALEDAVVGYFAQFTCKDALRLVARHEKEQQERQSNTQFCTTPQPVAAPVAI